MHGLILYSIFPQGHALITLLFDPTQEKKGRYCSEDQVRNSAGILVNISRLFLGALLQGQKNGGLTAQCLADVISYLLYILIFVFSQWLTQKVTFGSSSSQGQ